MNKLISPRSRAVFGGGLAFTGLLVIGGHIAHMANPPYPTVSTWLHVAALALLLGGSHYFIHVQPSIQELVKEVERRLHQERIMALEWAAIDFRKATFAEMSKGQKFSILFAVAFGIVLCFAGLDDFARSRWLTGFVFVTLGFLMFNYPSIIRIRMVDKIDEAARKLFSEMDGKGIKPH